MRLWITRQSNGLYMLTKHKPVIAEVEGRNFKDAYILPGEPVGMRNFCDLLLQLAGVTEPLRRLESIEVEITGNMIKDV